MNEEWATPRIKMANKGFTIVELLIVVVVIAILAAITIVAYNGIQNRAKASATQEAVGQAVKKIALWKVDNADQSPDLSTFTGLIGSGNMGRYQYTPGTGGAFCVTATTDNVSYYASDTQASPVLGACGGHGLNGGSTITNIVSNPSVESDTAGWGLGVNGSVASRSATSALVGGYGVTVTAPSNSIDSGISIPVANTLTAGTTYTASFTLRALTAGTYSLSTQGTSGGSGRENKVMTANTTARFTYTWTPSVSGSVVFYALRSGTSAGTHTFYVDGAMLTAGSSVPAYADGDTAGWAWNGARYNSTSTGRES